MYTWAANPLKADRAFKRAQTENDTSEENVMKHYELLGGKVVNQPKKTGKKNDKNSPLDIKKEEA